MSKTFKQAPRPSNSEVESFVQKGAGHDTKAETPKHKLKRLSVDLDEDLHRRFKAACAMAGTKMAVELADFIELRIEELNMREN